MVESRVDDASLKDALSSSDSGVLRILSIWLSDDIRESGPSQKVVGGALEVPTSVVVAFLKDVVNLRVYDLESGVAMFPGQCNVEIFVVGLRKFIRRKTFYCRGCAYI